MKAVLATLVFVCFALAASAQPVPGAYVPLAPCLLFDAPLQVGTTYQLVRGHCNVPAAANAVNLGIVADSYGPTGVTLWGSDIPWPGVVTFIVKKQESTSTTVRLCYPEVECRGEDLAVKVISVPIHLTLSVTGYYVPLP